MTSTIAIAILVRALVQVLAGILIAKGYIKADGLNVDEISGAVLFSLAFAWSWYSKQKLIQTTAKTTTPTDNAQA